MKNNHHIDYKGYKPTIGIECHVQLNTLTKLFSGSLNNVKNSKPNQQINHIDLGLPGALPVINHRAIELAVRAGFALHTRAQLFSKFDRKHYFYPDLPMGYQITQYDEPIILGGYINIKVNGQIKKIGITRAHLESDAGKSLHPTGQNYSLLDYNRAGVPLLEIVSEPDLSSALEARLYVTELYLAMKLAGVSEANLFYGNMRFDCNVSLSKTDQLGVRTETKNLNSFKSVEKAINAEIIRQISILEKGGKIIQETRGWNEDKQRGFTQRVKENADDYRYMPDPDLPPIKLEDSWLDEIQSSMPLLADDWRKKLNALTLTDDEINLLLKAEADYGGILDIVNNSISQLKKARIFANWLINFEIPFLQNLEDSDNDVHLTGQQRQQIYDKVYFYKDKNLINSTKLALLFNDLLGQPSLVNDLDNYLKAGDYLQNSNQDSLIKIVNQVIAENHKAVNDVLNGETKVIGFLVGQVMKLSKGQANPQIAQQLIMDEINKMKVQ